MACMFFLRNESKNFKEKINILLTFIYTEMLTKITFLHNFKIKCLIAYFNSY